MAGRPIQRITADGNHPRTRCQELPCLAASAVGLRYKLFEQELGFVDKLLHEDIRNNYDWNQRYYVVKQTTGFTEEVISREIKYCVDSLDKVCNNESAWNYLRGYVQCHAEVESRFDHCLGGCLTITGSWLITQRV